ncbi:hypothetical protein L3Y34_002506 [Caenorhabditis briggsae]|uniref:CUE domain-containing protein n=1 Tax=Caenorhabditis briggsae TaxID=6238 RepID=A0AAE9DEW5_CAEBR|nr:hypothetical protein L3Y34_002506 [Caenorhabditis briggsae]
MESYGTTANGEGEELLDFDRAMRDFQQMFPNVCAAQIEYVLRKYDGDVSATINELLYDNGNDGTSPASTATSSTPYMPRGNDILSQLRRRRHEINEKLRDNQKLLDRVTDVDTARAYEDQQLALLLEHREVSTLISEQKAKQKQYDSVPGGAQGRRKVQISKNSNFSARNSKNPEKTENRRRSEEQRVPDGPFIEGSSSNFTAKIKEKFKKASSGSRISRLFSAP